MLMHKITELSTGLLQQLSATWKQESEVIDTDKHLPLLKEEVETWTPGRDLSTNLTGWSLKKH